MTDGTWLVDRVRAEIVQPPQPPHVQEAARIWYGKNCTTILKMHGTNCAKVNSEAQGQLS